MFGFEAKVTCLGLNLDLASHGPEGWPRPRRLWSWRPRTFCPRAYQRTPLSIASSPAYPPSSATQVGKGPLP